ncbi:hypothetical protein KR074_008726 [Drosophila pseudoananassae]|nr:hypothetical protein KR074_008726 [Drosophila pseudoananassae]
MEVTSNDSGHAIMDRKTQMLEKRKTLEARRKSKGMKSIRVSMIPEMPENSWTYSFWTMTKRHQDDQKYVEPTFESRLEAPSKAALYLGIAYSLRNDDDKEPFYDPSFKRHQVPLHVRCLERFQESKKKFSSQFRRELKLLIDNQPNADCAWQFVRTVAYTTLWPPIHSRQELGNFERDFFKLTPKERARLDKIMNTEYN